MATATLQVPAAAEQARTVRLVASTAAHRAGIDDELLDDVRLAVSEAVALSVRRANSAQSTGIISIAMFDEDDSFVVEVSDDLTLAARSAGEDLELSLPLIRALAPGSDITENPAGGQTVSLSWPITGSTI
jgi:hypothetical protein